MEAETEKKLDQFVRNEVHCNVSRFVEFVLKNEQTDPENAPLSLEDFENLETYPEYYGKYVRFPGGTYEQLEGEWHRVDEIGFNKGNPEQDKKDNELDELEKLDPELQEIFEYWLVSSHLAEDLRDKGEPVAILSGLHVWGRTCTGQAISMDPVISEIYQDLKNR
jgi:hypothetical protein